MTMQYREVIDITPRKVSFDWEGLDTHVYPGDPVGSHCVNSLHLLFPAGENAFCRIFQEALPYLEDDPKLKKDAMAFIRQEAMHSRSHQGVVNHYEALGVDTSKFAKGIDRLIRRGSGDKMYGLFTVKSARLKRKWLAQRLAAIAVVEHFTCIMGMWALGDNNMEKAGMDPRMLDLLKWHCAEEIEHRNVAFDIYMHVSGNNHFGRWRSMLMVMPGVYRLLRACGMEMMAKDPALAGRKINFYRAWESAAAEGKLPSLKMLFKSTKRWFTRSYDPQTEADTQTALDYFAVSPAVQASLKA